jgi:hypothetical protein
MGSKLTPKQANKIIEYREYIFNFKVNMNVRTTPGIFLNSVQYIHELVITNIGKGNPFEFHHFVDDKNLIESINHHEDMVLQWIDGQLKGKPAIDPRLAKVGFK